MMGELFMFDGARQVHAFIVHCQVWEKDARLGILSCYSHMLRTRIVCDKLCGKDLPEPPSCSTDPDMPSARARRRRPVCRQRHVHWAYFVRRGLQVAWGAFPKVAHVCTSYGWRWRTSSTPALLLWEQVGRHKQDVV